ncbi:J domain-containing protein [Natranaeroarchaeum sulfidigenes]|uniref:DnaJ-class molecular chaperone n=1 Tax=Natranaeroarchaeum sulfidigenes TaxID=2784880 RepID=A0A897MQF8_9EURY|nr:J domain-containing protein [Natranaeroarchaeum sulfidigenes]QSG02208.1 DnaJ-class molecular chaperone [Natranaeroarchaeum sulfidigenes]
MTRDFYELLGVDEDASKDEIRDAFREMVQEYHPDRNDDPRATAQFTIIKKAYDTLKDPSERQSYDRLGHTNYVAKRLDGIPDLSSWPSEDEEDDESDTSTETTSSGRSSGATGSSSGTGRTTGSTGGSTSGTTSSAGSTSSTGYSSGTATSTNRTSGSSSTTGGASTTNGSSTSSTTSSSSGRSSSASSSSTATSQSSSSRETSNPSSSSQTGQSSTASTGRSRSSSASTGRASTTGTGSATTTSAAGSTTASASTGGATTSTGSARKTGTDDADETDSAGGLSGLLFENALVQWFGSVPLGWPAINLSFGLYLVGLAHYGYENAAGLEALVAALQAAGTDTDALSALLFGPATEYIGSAWEYVYVTDPAAIGPSLLFALGTILMPVLFFIVIRRTRHYRGRDLSYLFALAVSVPLVVLATTAVDATYGVFETLPLVAVLLGYGVVPLLAGLVLIGRGFVWTRLRRILG